LLIWHIFQALVFYADKRMAMGKFACI